MGPEAQPSRFERHPVLSLALVLGGLLTLGVLAAELTLRATLDYHIDYYTGVTRPGRVEYPYGPIYINSRGHPDLEWDLSDTRARLAFYGDSVTYGVGAGHGHRLSDLVREAHPELQVLTLAAVGARLKDPGRVERLARDFGVETLVYVMNLNDVTPDPLRRPSRRDSEPSRRDSEPGRRDSEPPPVAELSSKAVPEATEAEATEESVVRRLRKLVLERLDVLRGKSYLYNFLRLRVKNLLVLQGFEASGFQAVELQPGQHGAVFDLTAARVNEAARLLQAAGVRFCLLILPYEMQISSQAATVYRDMGVRWEEGFLEGSPQRAITSRLSVDIESLDATAAFVDPGDAEESRARNGLGVYFVYDRGDKIDWNHPTRAGHRRIADLVLERRFCGL